jgi:hypothetical protein
MKKKNLSLIALTVYYLRIYPFSEVITTMKCIRLTIQPFSMLNVYKYWMISLQIVYVVVFSPPTHSYVLLCWLFSHINTSCWHIYIYIYIALLICWCLRTCNIISVKVRRVHINAWKNQVFRSNHVQTWFD